MFFVSASPTNDKSFRGELAPRFANEGSQCITCTEGESAVFTARLTHVQQDTVPEISWYV